MAQRVIKSLDTYAAKLVRIADETARGQRQALAASKKRATFQFGQAARQLAGSDRVLSGVGKSGGYLHVKFRDSISGVTAAGGWEATAGGPWSIRDNTVSGGPTQERIITPNLGRTPRPAGPAIMFKPSLKSKTGIFMTNNNTEGGPYVVHSAGRGPREPAWGRAVQRLQPRIVELHQRAFDETSIQIF